MIKALLFDMDGVLADSEGLSIAVGIDYFASIGVKADESSFRDSLGCGERAFFDITAAKLGLSGSPYSYDEASAFFRKRYTELIRGRNIALPGAGIVEKARACGIMTALASSAPEWKVMANIEAVGLSPAYFDFIATGADIKRNKPEKDIYELCLINLGCDASQAVVFEDTKGGIESGKRAGCRVVSMLTTIGREEAELYANAAVDNLASIPDFSSSEELEDFLFPHSSELVRYGACWIKPLEKKLPYDAVLRAAIEAARKAWEHGYAPYSEFRVGAAVVSARTGRIYSGCNVENSSYGATICAERNAITTAVACEGAIGIDLLVVYSDDDPPAPPCAVCLQVIAEFARPETRIVLVTPDSEPVEYSFSQMLPRPFIFPKMR